MRELKIFCNHIYAGLLTEHSKQEYTFCYDDGYFINPSLPAISLTLSSLTNRTQANTCSPSLQIYYLKEQIRKSFVDYVR